MLRIERSIAFERAIVIFDGFGGLVGRCGLRTDARRTFGAGHEVVPRALGMTMALLDLVQKVFHPLCRQHVDSVHG